MRAQCRNRGGKSLLVPIRKVLALCISSEHKCRAMGKLAATSQAQCQQVQAKRKPIGMVLGDQVAERLRADVIIYVYNMYRYYEEFCLA